MTYASSGALVPQGSDRDEHRPSRPADVCLFVTGLALCFLCVLTVRYPLSALSAWAGSWIPRALKVPAGLSLPSVVSWVPLLLVLAALCFIPAASRARIARGQASKTGPSFVPARSWFAWLVVAGLIMACFVWVERRGTSMTPLVLPWIAVIVGGAVLAAREDRRRQIPGARPIGTREALLVLSGATLLLVLWLWEAGSLKYAMIGDEWAFYAQARELLELPVADWPVFEASGVFGDVSMLVSSIQALFMKSFGTSAVGWKASGAAMLLLTLGFLYLWLRIDMGAIPAAVAAGVFGLSPLVVAWARIGKPLAFLLPALAAVGYFYSRSRSGSLLHAFLAGVSAGFGIQLFSLGGFLATGWLGALLLLGLLEPASWRCKLWRCASAFAGWSLAAIPILVQLDYFEHLRQKNLGGPGLVYAATNTVHAALAFLHFEASNHFLCGQVLGGLSAFLALAGLCMSLASRQADVLALWLLCIAGAGTTAYYEYPPMTRLLLLALPWAVFAGIATHLFLSVFRPRPWLSAFLAAATLAVAFLLGVRAEARTDGWSTGASTSTLRLLEDLPAGESAIVVIPEHWDSGLENHMFAAHAPGTRAVPESGAEEALREAEKSRPQGRPVVVLAPGVLLSDGAVELLRALRIQVFAVGEGENPSVLPPRQVSLRDLGAFRNQDANFACFRIANVEQSWGRMRVGRSVSGGNLEIGGQVFSSGIGTHAHSTIEVLLDPGFSSFHGLCGVDGGVGGEGAIVFRVLDGERELFRSPILRGGSDPVPFDVDVHGTSRLTLEAVPAGPSIDFCHADWVNLELIP